MRRIPCVEFENVSKNYRHGLLGRRTVRALDCVSLQIASGEIFGLVGPNRAGKTTLVKLLLSICRPSQGRVVRLARDARDRSTLARVGYVHERPSFPQYLTAEGLLFDFGTLSLVPKPELMKRIGPLLNRVGLADRGPMPIYQYSKGMQQRLALAQALINQPDLLVLDEPTEGMDIGARQLTRDVVREHQASGGTTILISHALGEVAQLCDRVGVLNAGRLVHCGPVADLLCKDESLADKQEARRLEEALIPLYEEILV